MLITFLHLKVHTDTNQLFCNTAPYSPSMILIIPSKYNTCYNKFYSPFVCRNKSYPTIYTQRIGEHAFSVTEYCRCHRSRLNMAESRKTQEMKGHDVIPSLAASNPDSEIATFLNDVQSFAPDTANGQCGNLSHRKQHYRCSVIIRTPEFFSSV